MIDVAERQAAAVAVGVQLFDSDIWDPPVGFDDVGGQADRWRAAITRMIAVCGWSWEVPYLGDGDVEWCGFYVGACYAAAGIKPEILFDYFSSPYRLQRYGSHRPVNHDARYTAIVGAGRQLVRLDERTKKLPAMPDGSKVRSGDIMLVGGIASGPGKHVTMIEKIDDDGRIWTLEGNARGNGPDGKRRQGVVRRFYPVGLSTHYQHVAPATYHPRWIVRPAASDFVGA